LIKRHEAETTRIYANTHHIRDNNESRLAGMKDGRNSLDDQVNEKIIQVKYDARDIIKRLFRK
jgi:hypothetical protein